MRTGLAISFALILCLPQIAGAGEWIEEIVDPQDDHLFGYPQIVISDQGVSHTLYHEGNNYGVRYAVNHGEGWQSEVLDDVGFLMPVYDLALNADGAPHVGFRGATGHLEYAIRETGGWATAKIDSSDVVDRIGVCMDADDRPIFAYVRDDVLRLARWIEPLAEDGHWESEAIGPIGDCRYLKLEMDPSNAPVIGAFDHQDGTLRVYTGTPDYASWTLDNALEPAYADVFFAFDLDPDGLPYWCWIDAARQNVMLASNDGGGWSQQTLTPPPVNPLYQKMLVLYDFTFDRQGRPGLATTNHYAHMEEDVWVWREIAILFMAPLGAAFDFHPNGNATIVTGPTSYTWWGGQPVLGLSATGHAWTEAYAPWDLVLQNTGTMPLVIEEIDYLSGDPAVFPVLDTTFPLTVPPDGSGAITFDFRPPADGDYTAEVELSTNDPVTPEPVLSLEGNQSSAGSGGTLPVMVENVVADLYTRRLLEDRPLPGAEVTLLDGGEPVYGPLTTSELGLVTFTDVEPDTYNIMATREFPDPDDPEITRSVRAYVQSVTVSQGLNPQPTAVLPDSLLQQAYLATYQLEGMGDSPLTTYDYGAAEEARAALADLGQNAGTTLAIQSISRLLLACRATEMMYQDAAMVGGGFIQGLGQTATFLMYSNNWLTSFFDLLKMLWKSFTDKMSALMDMVILVAKWLLKVAVDASVRYALSFLPCDDADFVCVRDLGKAAWNSLNYAYDGFGFGAFNFSEWNYFVEKAELLLGPTFYQFIYIDTFTNSDLQNAVDRSSALDVASTFDYVAPRTYEDIEENAGFTDTVAETSADLRGAAQLMYATAVAFDILETIPGLSMLGTISEVMAVSSWLALGSSLGLTGGVFFTQPLALENVIDDIYDPFDKSLRPAPPTVDAPRGRPLSDKARNALTASLKAASDSYTAVVDDIRSAVQQGDLETAGLALEDLAEADGEWIRQRELAQAPVLSVAGAARDAHPEFAAQYDTLLTRNVSAGAEHLKTYLNVLLLPSDEKGDLSDALLQQLDATLDANDALGQHIETVLETVADLPQPAILAAAEITRSAERLRVGRVDTLTIRLENLGGADAADIDLVLRTSENLEAVGADSLRIDTLAAGAQSATYLFRVRPAGADSVDARWTLDIAAPGAEVFDESGIFLSPAPGDTPGTGGALDSANVYNYPNPFDPGQGSTTLRFSLSQDARVTIRLYDGGNRLVRELVNGASHTAAEEVSVSWDGRNGNGEIVANGVYFAVIESDRGERAVGKIAVLR